MSEQRRLAHTVAEDLRRELAKLKAAQSAQNVVVEAQYQAQLQKLRDNATASEQHILAAAEAKVREAQALAVIPQTHSDEALKGTLQTCK